MPIIGDPPEGVRGQLDARVNLVLMRHARAGEEPDQLAAFELLKRWRNTSTTPPCRAMFSDMRTKTHAVIA